jgi:type II secretory pathway component PulJ
VALILAGLLMSMIGQVVHQFVQSSQAIEQEQARYAQVAALRRVLHRDLQNLILDNATVSARSNGFACLTSHSLLTSHPLPVRVVWELSDGKIARHETARELSYAKRQTLVSGVQSWSLSFFQAAEQRWVELSTRLLSEPEKGSGKPAAEQQTERSSRRTLALKLGLALEDKEYEIIEARPSDEADQTSGL